MALTPNGKIRYQFKTPCRFGIDIETCERCGVKVKVMASIEAPAVIAHILKHLQQKEAVKAAIPPPERLPSVMRRFD